jgi:hypothetical protein
MRSEQVIQNEKSAAIVQGQTEGELQFNEQHQSNETLAR